LGLLSKDYRIIISFYIGVASPFIQFFIESAPPWSHVTSADICGRKSPLVVYYAAVEIAAEF